MIEFELRSVHDEAYLFPVLDNAYCCVVDTMSPAVRTHD